MPRDTIGALVKPNKANTLDVFVDLDRFFKTPSATRPKHIPGKSFEAVFSVYRNYDEDDYEDWDVKAPVLPYILSEEVKMQILKAANDSLVFAPIGIADKIWFYLEGLASTFLEWREHKVRKLVAT